MASTAWALHRRAGEGAVEIDDMQIFEPDSLESARLRGGIVIEHGRAVHIALDEAHALPFLQIDRGKQNHGRHLRKLAINARPSLWLFSGWNCTPTRLSRATAAVSGAP